MNEEYSLRLRIDNFILTLAYTIMAVCIVAFAVLVWLGNFKSPRQVMGSIFAGGQDLVEGIFYDFDETADLAALPESLRTEIANNWTVVQSNDIYEHYNGLGQFGFEDMIGLTVSDERTIYLSENDLTAHYTFFHESGHVLDYINNWVSEDAAFQALYEEEAGNYADANYRQTNGYAASCPEEFFASVFCDLMLNNEENLESVPRTAAFIKSLYEGE